MLRVWRSTFLFCCLLLTSCSDAPQPHHSVKLTPATIQHADFSTEGTLAIGTLAQVAVYTENGELVHLLDLPRAERSWRPIWLMPDLLAINDGAAVFLWQPGSGLTQGPWRPREAVISAMFAISGRLLLAYADGTQLLQRLPLLDDTLMAAQAAPAFGFNQLASPAANRLMQAQSLTDDIFVRAYAGGLVSATEVHDEQQRWQLQLNQSQYIRALATSETSLTLVTQAVADPFARGRAQKVVQVDAKNGKVIQSFPLQMESQAVQLLVDGPYTYIGGSGNCVLVIDGTETSKPFCYPKERRWGQNTGQVIALYQNADTLFAVTSSGYLQIWNKPDIVSLLTDK